MLTRHNLDRVAPRIQQKGQALFRYIDIPAPYAAQVTACANIGYTIASVHNAVENQAILQLIRNSARPMPTCQDPGT